MPSLLFTVFVLQLILHLINTVGAKAVNDAAWAIYSKLLSATSHASKEQTRLRREIVKLQRELNGISAQDDFAKWAKLRRQLDKAVAEHDKYNNASQSTRSTFDSRLNTIRMISMNGTRLFLQYYYRKSAMFWLPKGWVPYYAEWLLSWPKAPLGSVSVQMWGIACGSIIGMVSEALIAGFLLAMGRTSDQAQQKEKKAMPQKAQ